MKRHLLIVPLLGLALFALPGSASAQNPFLSLFAPFTNTQVRPVANAPYGTVNYNNAYGNRSVVPYYPQTNYSAVQYQQPQTICRNGSCWTPPASTANVNCANGFCATGACQNGYCPNGSCANGTCTTNRPVTAPYYPQSSYPVNNATNCQLDAYGRCITPGHPHYGQIVGNGLAPIGNYQAGYNANLYRDRNFVPANYNTPVNTPYYGTQLR